MSKANAAGGSTRKAKADVNLARINDSSLLNKYTLPGDVEADLKDAFNFYDKEELGYISMPHFKNILHNFGYHAKQMKDQQEELRKNDPEINKRQGVAFPECQMFVGYRWHKGGRAEEATECFKLFDKKDREVINATDLKAVLTNYLEFPVTQADVEDFIAMCNGGDAGDGNVRKPDFNGFYLS